MGQIFLPGVPDRKREWPQTGRYRRTLHPTIDFPFTLFNFEITTSSTLHPDWYTSAEGRGFDGRFINRPSLMFFYDTRNWRNPGFHHTMNWGGGEVSQEAPFTRNPVNCHLRRADWLVSFKRKVVEARWVALTYTKKNCRHLFGGPCPST